jgi:hypothetical protein
MKIGRQSMVTDAQRVELWRRYRAGEAVLSIAKEFGQRSSSNVYRVLEANGGIAPAQRSRALAACPREMIENLIASHERIFEK